MFRNRQWRADDNRGSRVFNEIEARRIVDEIVSYMRPDHDLFIQITSWWSSGQRWARNRASLSSDQRDVTVQIGRDLQQDYVEEINTYMVGGTTNQIDSVSLDGLTNYIEFYAPRSRRSIPPDRELDIPRFDVKGTEVWSDQTFERSVVDNAAAVDELTRISEAEQLMSAGYIETSGCTTLRYYRDTWGRVQSAWGHVTQAQCSATVRHPKGEGSGWAGKSSFEIAKVNIAEVARLAFEKCKHSLHPVRIEPGRYQTILEPQATGQMVGWLVHELARSGPEDYGEGPVFLGRDRSVNRLISKLGLRIVDERISIYHDSTDPTVGTHPSLGYDRVEFIKNGVLTELVASYTRNLNDQSTVRIVPELRSFAMSGGTVSTEEMISSTKRGLLVSRLTQPKLLDPSSLLFTGLTRDGLWLIENGVITKAVRNFRWTESPLFIFNNVEQIGVAEKIFSTVSVRHQFHGPFANSLSNVVAPTIKVNDFSFTSTIDAI